MQVKLRVAATAALIASMGILSAAMAPQSAAQARQRPPSSAALAAALQSELYGVSCASASACTAVGHYVSAAGTTVSLAERWDGTTWAVQSTPNPSDATASYLNGASCTSASACTAVGWYQTSPGVYETLAERWDGTTWAVQSTPNPSGATASYLFGVSCGSASACTATGYTLNPNYKALAERWNGTAWALQSIPIP